MNQLPLLKNLPPNGKWKLLSLGVDHCAARRFGKPWSEWKGTVAGPSDLWQPKRYSATPKTALFFMAKISVAVSVDGFQLEVPCWSLVGFMLEPLELCGEFPQRGQDLEAKLRRAASSEDLAERFKEAGAVRAWNVLWSLEVTVLLELLYQSIPVSSNWVGVRCC